MVTLSLEEVIRGVEDIAPIFRYENLACECAFTSISKGKSLFGARVPLTKGSVFTLVEDYIGCPQRDFTKKQKRTGVRWSVCTSVDPSCGTGSGSGMSEVLDTDAEFHIRFLLAVASTDLSEDVLSSPSIASSQ